MGNRLRYRSMIVTLHHITKDAIKVSQGGTEAWIPRTCLDWGTDNAMEAGFDILPAEDTSIRVVDWKAAQLPFSFDT